MHDLFGQRVDKARARIRALRKLDRNRKLLVERFAVLDAHRKHAGEQRREFRDLKRVLDVLDVNIQSIECDREVTPTEEIDEGHIPITRIDACGSRGALHFASETAARQYLRMPEHASGIAGVVSDERY